MITLPLYSIISGGQTGADRGGLLAGMELGLQTGGFSAHGWMTEDGPDPHVLRAYGLEEWPVPGYPARTRANVQMADATIVCGKLESSGSRLTIDLCYLEGKPCLPIEGALLHDTAGIGANQLREWLRLHRVGVLNVAGNRASVYPKIQTLTETFLIRALRGYV